MYFESTQSNHSISCNLKRYRVLMDEREGRRGGRLELIHSSNIDSHHWQPKWDAANDAFAFFRKGSTLMSQGQKQWVLYWNRSDQASSQFGRPTHEEKLLVFCAQLPASSVPQVFNVLEKSRYRNSSHDNFSFESDLIVRPRSLGRMTGCRWMRWEWVGISLFQVT